MVLPIVSLVLAEAALPSIAYLPWSCLSIYAEITTVDAVLTRHWS